MTNSFSTQKITTANISDNGFISLVESIPTAIYVVDNEGIVVFVNSCFTALLQYDNSDMVGENICNVLSKQPS